MTACNFPTKINQLISISTPYSPVLVANAASWIAALFAYGGGDFYELLEKKDSQNYNNSVLTLANPTFFSKLKSKWNKLSGRPPLTVIAGVSGHLMTSVYTPSLVLEINKRYPFDTLVLGSEQVNIKYEDIEILHEPNVNCVSVSKNFKYPCCSTISFPHHHNCKCALPCFDISYALVKTIQDAIDQLNKNDANNNDSFEDQVKEAFKNNPIVIAFKEALEHKPCSNEQYKQYYDILNGRFSHLNIVDQYETTGILLSKIME